MCFLEDATPDDSSNTWSVHKNRVSGVCVLFMHPRSAGVPSAKVSIGRGAMHARLTSGYGRGCLPPFFAFCVNISGLPRPAPFIRDRARPRTGRSRSNSIYTVTIRGSSVPNNYKMATVKILLTVYFYLSSLVLYTIPSTRRMQGIGGGASLSEHAYIHVAQLCLSACD